jgi:hypothetical protein
VPQEVLGRLVGEAALEDEAAALGLSVGDETVREQILAIPGFQGVDGSFDREAYRFVLEQNGLSVAEFEEQIRTETAAGLIRQAVVAGVVFPPSSPTGSTPCARGADGQLGAARARGARGGGARARTRRRCAPSTRRTPSSSPRPRPGPSPMPG